MHIKKLEICGFKSFVDRTVVHFDHDVIGIVGPNGCGKSNIVDAIRWCMGEQSAKHLRGKAMEDVIFNGSETRGPARHGRGHPHLRQLRSRAAASLPIEYRDYAEIAVTRRLYRDGTASTCSTRPQVRLKDIIDVFLGTGVGTKAYSIVEQGKIGLIVSARAGGPPPRSSRRPPGITKFKSRKKEAERKMEMTRAKPAPRRRHRLRELERNVASLSARPRRPSATSAYRNELESLMLHEASHKFLEIFGRREVRGRASRTSAEQVASRRAPSLEMAEPSLEIARAEALALREPRRAGPERGLRRRQRSPRARSRDRRARTTGSGTSASGSKPRRPSSATCEDKPTRWGSSATKIEASLAALEHDEARRSGGRSASTRPRGAACRGASRAKRELTELRSAASKAGSQVAAAKAKLSGLERRTARDAGA